MIKIEVTTTATDLKAGTSQRTGKPYSIREQEAWGYFCDPQGKPHPHPQKIRITLGDQQEPYAPGNYTLAPESLYPDRFGQMTCRPVLKPITATVQRAA